MFLVGFTHAAIAYLLSQDLIFCKLMPSMFPSRSRLVSIIELVLSHFDCFPITTSTCAIFFFSCLLKNGSLFQFIFYNALVHVLHVCDNRISYIFLHNYHVLHVYRRMLTRCYIRNLLLATACTISRSGNIFLQLELYFLRAFISMWMCSASCLPQAALVRESFLGKITTLIVVLSLSSL